MRIERLTPEDEMMLWPDARWPQDIGALVLLDGEALLDSGDRVRLDRIRAVVASRLHMVPRFRQVIRVPPPRLGPAYWADASDFNLDDHLGVVQLPPPGSEAQLLAAVEALRQRRLDRRHPLWQMWFLTGLPDRRVALFVRMHHCIADGMAGVATMTNFLDPAVGVGSSAPRPWSPTREPSTAELFADKRDRRFRKRRDALSRLAHPLATGRRAAAAWPAVRELLAERPLPPTSLDVVVGTTRRMALIRSRLDSVDAIANENGATINDVLLALVTGGVRRLLAGRHELTEGLTVRIYVPVSLHEGPRTKARGNLIGQIVVPLPVGIADPERRLRAITHETRVRKALSRPSLGVFPHHGLIGRAVLALLSRQRVNLASADIPGPGMTLCFAGARLLEVFPIAPLLGRNSLLVAGISYAGQFNMAVVADGNGYPDLDVFVAAAEAELGALAPRSAASHVAAGVG